MWFTVCSLVLKSPVAPPPILALCVWLDSLPILIPPPCSLALPPKKYPTLPPLLKEPIASDPPAPLDPGLPVGLLLPWPWPGSPPSNWFTKFPAEVIPKPGGAPPPPLPPDGGGLSPASLWILNFSL